MIRKFAFETPLQSLELQIAQGTYLFAIASWYEKYPEYMDFLLTYRENFEMILDNGAFEEGVSIDIQNFIDIIEELRPTYAVVPDALMDLPETMRLANEFYRHNIPNWLKLMVVPQGKDQTEWIECLHVMTRKFRGKFDMVGIPRNQYPNRLTLCRHVMEFTPKPIHLLGCVDPSEVAGISKANVPIASIDTSWPARKTLNKLGKEDRLDFENDVLDPDAFAESVNDFLQIINPGLVAI